MLQLLRSLRVSPSLRHRRMLFTAGVILAPVVWALGWGQLPGHRPTPAEARALVQSVLDGSKSREERSAAYAELIRAQPDDLKKGLLDILQNADSDFSSRAASTLLHFEDLEEETRLLIVRQIPRWVDGSRCKVLDRHSTGKNSPRLRFVPRAVLEAVVAGNIDPPKDVIAGSVEYAARILAFAYDPQDEALFQRALLAFPSSYSLWLALGRWGQLPPDHATLGGKVMHDDSQPYLARVAAAGALARTDPEASQFAHAEIRSFLEVFGPHDMSSPASAKFPPGTWISGTRLEEKDRYVGTKWILGNLLNLDTPEAEQLTLKYLLAPDPAIRRALALVAVRRWPQRFLEATSAETWPMYEGQEYEMLLSLIAYFHPDLRPRIEERIGGPMVEKLFQRIELGSPIWWSEEVGAFMPGW